MYFAKFKPSAIETKNEIEGKHNVCCEIFKANFRDKKQTNKQTIKKATGSTDNIAKSIDFLINNNYIAGQILFIDGGENL